MNHAMTPAQVAAYLANEKQKEIRTLDNKALMQQTSRPLGMKTYFTSEGDDTTDPTKIGGGQLMKMCHAIGDDTNQTLHVDFNVKENRTFLHEGYVMWQSAKYDQVSLEIIPHTTTYSSGSGTYYNLYGGYLIIPAAGDGTVVVQPEDIRLVEVPISRDSGLRETAFWNADYNTTTHQFENITAAPIGNGIYNMFGVEVVLARFANRLLLLNNGFMMFQSADTEEIGCNMRLKIHMHTENLDHDWDAACIITFHREKTC